MSVYQLVMLLFENVQKPRNYFKWDMSPKHGIRTSPTYMSRISKRKNTKYKGTSDARKSMRALKLSSLKILADN